jgi:plasmid stabilization system protein ParE
MEERISRKPYEVSDQFFASRVQIYDYTHDTFGYFQAERYLQKIKLFLDVRNTK